MLSYLVYVSIAAMGKIVIGVMAGVFVSPHLSAPIESEKGLSFITLRVLLSAMLFSNVCFDVSLTLLSKYYWAVIMSLVPMLLGALLSVACTRLVSREYKCLVVLGSTFQNGLVFPLSVVTSIKGVAWLDAEGVRHCQQFVFLYNLTCALGLWSVGSPMVKHYKDKYANEKIEAESEADYLASLLSFYRRLVRRGRQDGRGSVLLAETDPALGDARVASATGDAIERLDTLLQRTHRTAHTSLRDMTLLDVLGEFMYRIRAVRGAGTGSRTAAVLMPPSTLVDSADDARAEEHEEMAIKPREATTPTTAGTAPHSHGPAQARDDRARREAGVAEAVVRAALATDLAAEDGDASPTQPSTVTPRTAAASSRSNTRGGGGGSGAAPTVAAEVQEAADAIPETDAGRQLVLYRPLSGTGKMRPIDTRKFDLWQSRQEKKRHDAAMQADAEAESQPSTVVATRRTARTGVASMSTSASGGGGDLGADASALFTPLEDVYQDPSPSFAAASARRKPGKSKDPFTYAYVSTIGNIVHGCCQGSDSSDADEEADQAGLPRNMELRERDRPCSYRFRKFLKIANGAFQTMPVWATLLAICISLIPPLRWLAETIPCAMIIQGLHIVGDGCVPVQLVVLGCTLATKRLVDPLVLQRTDEEMQERERRRPETLVQRLTLKKLRDRVMGNSRSSKRGSANRSKTVVTTTATTTTGGPVSEPYQEGQPLDAELILRSQPSVVATAEKDGHPSSSPTSALPESLDWSDAATLDLLAAEGLSSSEAPKRWTWWERVPSATRLAIIVIALRLIIVPAISFLVVHLLMIYKIMPTDRPFVVSILIGISSPAAVNSSLACTMHGYHADEYSRVMFVMHVAAIVTSTFWLVVSITYTEKMGTDLYR